MKCNCSSCCYTKGTTFRSDAGIQGRLVPGLGNITLWREGGRGGHQSFLFGGTKVRVHTWRGFLFLFFNLYFLSFSSKTFFFFSELCDRKRKYLQQNEKIRTFPLKEVGLDSDQISRRWNDCWTGIKRRINVILISKLSTNKMLHSVHFLKLT